MHKFYFHSDKLKKIGPGQGENLKSELIATSHSFCMRCIKLAKNGQT